MGLVLGLHVLAGAVGLLLGPAVALARNLRGVHTAAGWVYVASVHAMCSTTYVLVAADTGLWPFAGIALATQVAATAGVRVRRRRRPGWLVRHVQLMLGSYLSFVTAFSVQTVGGVLSWVVPTVVGSLAVALVTARVARPRRRLVPVRA